MINWLCCGNPSVGVCTLIMSSTRDLAMKTLKFTKQLGEFTGACPYVFLL
jgi:hypothetical protein